MHSKSKRVASEIGCVLVTAIMLTAWVSACFALGLGMARLVGAALGIEL